MKILFYDTKNYDSDSFNAVCAFVSSDVCAETLSILHTKQVKLVLMRCAGYNNIDLEPAKSVPPCAVSAAASA